MHLNIHRQNHDFDQSDERINHWLAERQDLVVSLAQLSKLKPYKSLVVCGEELSNFTTLLIDYVSAGQFEIFETIFNAAEKAPQKVPFNAKIMVALLRTTNRALDFAEKYQEATADTDLDQLESDLNELGELLATRLELEDQLIELYAEATTILNLS